MKRANRTTGPSRFACKAGDASVSAGGDKPRPYGVALALLFAAVPATAAESVTVVSWGGSYERACVEGYHKAFTAETGIEIKLEDYNGGLAEVRAQVDSGAVHWDVVDVELADGVRGCDEGSVQGLRSRHPACRAPTAPLQRTTTTRTQSPSAAPTRSTTPPSTPTTPRRSPARSLPRCRTSSTSSAFPGAAACAVRRS